MQAVKYGRKTFSFAEGVTVFTGMSVTEKAMSDEDMTKVEVQNPMSRPCYVSFCALRQTIGPISS